MKKKLFSIFIALFMIIPIMLFSACGDDYSSGGSGNTHDSSKWFTEAELTEKGLSGLTAPTGLNGELNSSTYWFNDGYSFSQPCPDVDTFTQNAQTYLDYFAQNYDGYFGFISSRYGVKYGDSETWYVLEQGKNLSSYFDDNPSKLYKFYYITDKTLDDEGYFVQGVYTLEIRYESNSSDPDNYLFKLFIEDAGSNHYGSYTYHYKIR